MGTKSNPGEYECYAKAGPDEPIFTLRAKDVSAPYLVEIWVAVRRGQFAQARRRLSAMIADQRVQKLVGECDKFDEALECGNEMRAWRGNM